MTRAEANTDARKGGKHRNIFSKQSYKPLEFFVVKHDEMSSFRFEQRFQIIIKQARLSIAKNNLKTLFHRVSCSSCVM